MRLINAISNWVIVLRSGKGVHSSFLPSLLQLLCSFLILVSRTRETLSQADNAIIAWIARLMTNS